MQNYSPQVSGLIIYFLDKILTMFWLQRIFIINFFAVDTKIKLFLNCRVNIKPLVKWTFESEGAIKPL